MGFQTFQMIYAQLGLKFDIFSTWIYHKRPCTRNMHIKLLYVPSLKSSPLRFCLRLMVLHNFVQSLLSLAAGCQSKWQNAIWCTFPISALQFSPVLFNRPPPALDLSS